MADATPPRTSPAGMDSLIRLARAQPLGGTTGLALLLVALVALNAVLLPGRFATFGTLQSMMFQLPELGILALAMVIPLISGGLNLAIIATANQCALAMAWILKALAPAGASGSTVALAIAAALLAGLLLSLLIGLLTGFLVANMGVHPILVTLGTMSVVNGVSIYLTRGTVIAGLPEPFLVIGNGVVAGVPIPFLILLAAAGATAFVLNRTPFGLAVFMIGSNLEAARYAGIDTKRVLVGVYTMSSLLCFLAACVMLSRFNSASAGYAESYLLITILAAVLGGVDPFGGFGRIAGLMLALAVLQVISSGFNLMGLSQHLTLAIWGLTLIAVMGVKAAAAPLARRLLPDRTPKGAKP
ncbi:ABC transporter permease [Prosthecomicrobium sp. N25]|uniref:ABC transporter permease n=1 Tax=Prosthecomicrobium sp. N25 TaxID=3129254 RepID=UPI0030779385